MIKLSLWYLIRFPSDFIYPPRRERTPTELYNRKKAA
jgi:hypothetical protein